MKSHNCLSLLFLLTTLACADDAQLAPAAGRDSWAVVGGTREPEEVNLTAAQKLSIGAVMWKANDGTSSILCTGTLIGSRKVLTAAHCVIDEDTLEVSPPSRFAFSAGADTAAPVAVRNVTAVEPHPDYVWGANANHDVALLWLDRSVPGTDPLPLNCASLDADDFVGESVENAGYGITDGEGANNTRRWWVVEEVVRLTAFDFTVDGYGERGVCMGDSGGPSLWETADGLVRIMGTLSWGDPQCGYRDHFARVDHNCDFITGQQITSIPLE